MKQPNLPKDYVAIIDEFGRVDEKLAGYRHLIARHEEIKKQVREWFAEASPELEKIVDGRQFAIAVSACREVREIASMKDVLRVLGREKFLEHAKISLKALQAELPEKELEPLLLRALTGPRNIAITARALPRKKAA